MSQPPRVPPDLSRPPRTDPPARTDPPPPPAAGCPFHRGAVRRSPPAEPTGPGGGARRSRPPTPNVPGGPVELRSLAAGRQVLRAGDAARQDGFGIREAARSPVKLKPPVLSTGGFSFTGE